MTHKKIIISIISLIILALLLGSVSASDDDLTSNAENIDNTKCILSINNPLNDDNNDILNGEIEFDGTTFRAFIKNCQF